MLIIQISRQPIVAGNIILLTQERKLYFILRIVEAL